MSKRDSKTVTIGCGALIGIVLLMFFIALWLVPWLTVQGFAIWGINLAQGQVMRTWVIVYLLHFVLFGVPEMILK